MTFAGSVAGDDRVRLFCALQLPDPVVDDVVAWQYELPHRAFRLVPRENIHVTLAFLGHRPRAEVERICAALEEAAQAAEPIVLRARRYRETRSVGMLVLEDEGRAASRLANDVQDRLERLGVYEREQRAWLPHLSVVRFRERPRLSPAVPDLGSVAPSAAAVYLSRLGPGGAEYVVVEKFGLGG